MKVLLVTGQLAKETVNTYAKQSPIETEVVTLNTAVAAFLTPPTIIEHLKNKTNLPSFNLILTPGLLRGDTAIITQALGIPVYKGPRYAADLPVVLDMLWEVQLSTTIPADELLKQQLTAKALAEITNIENQRATLLQNPGNMIVGGVAVGKDFPMRVLAEIVDAPLMDKETIQQTARCFAQAGADFIDVGMAADESQPQKAAQIIHWIREVTHLPLSIDSLDPAEIKAAVKAGAQLVLSADAGNLEAIAPYIKDVSVVVIPTNQSIGYMPKKASERVAFLEQIITKAQRLGVNNLLADLILDPQEILNSFLAFQTFAQKHPALPLFVGVSNVTELFDADSVGLNALLTRLSAEIGCVGILLATEKSNKAKGTIAEEATAAKMMFLAKKRQSVPKDLGVDLLILKDKRLQEEPYNPNIETTAKSVIIAPEKTESTTLDHIGTFRILLDHHNNLIVALHYSPSNPNESANIIKGKTAQAIYMKILELGLVSKLDHSAYLGNELTKAEIALRTGKNYLQDASLF